VVFVWNVVAGFSQRSGLPIADLEHRFAISLAIHCKRIFQIGDRRLLIGDFRNEDA
jgi:hypothetical protein